MIERIEQLGPELKVSFLVHLDLLRNGEIEPRQACAAYDADTRTAEGLRRWNWIGKRVRIKPPLDGPLRCRQLRICDEIRPSHAIAAKVQHASSTQCRRERESALQDMNSRYLPVPQEQIRRRAPGLTPPPAPPPRQFIRVAGNHSVGH